MRWLVYRSEKCQQYLDIFKRVNGNFFETFKHVIVVAIMLINVNELIAGRINLHYISTVTKTNPQNLFAHDKTLCFKIKFHFASHTSIRVGTLGVASQRNPICRATGHGFTSRTGHLLSCNFPNNLFEKKLKNVTLQPRLTTPLTCHGVGSGRQDKDEGDGLVRVDVRLREVERGRFDELAAELFQYELSDHRDDLIEQPGV